MKEYRQHIFFGILFLIGLVYLYYRSNEWHSRLSGPNGTSKVKTTNYYEYIYKVNKDYFSTSTGGDNVGDFNTEKVQYFLVAYDSTDPAIHTVLWSSKFYNLIPLGELIHKGENEQKLIEKHTTGWNMLTPFADMNDKEKLSKYEAALKEANSRNLQRL